MGMDTLTSMTGFVNGNGGVAEPQRGNNGLIYVTLPPGVQGVPNDTVLQLAIQTFDLPKEQNGIVQVGHLNESRKFAGRVEYQDLSCTFNDYIDLDTGGFIQSWRQAVYNPSNGRIGWKRNYAGTGHIDLYSPDGQYARSYTLIGVWPSQYDPGGQINMGGEDVLQISLTLTIDKAVPGVKSGTLGGGGTTGAFAPITADQ